MINLKDVSKAYGAKVILRDVNLVIPEGAFVMLSGESGAGKSTLLNIISGMEKPTSGKVIIDNKEIDKMNERERVEFYRYTIGMIFQSLYLQPKLSVMENIMLPGVFAGMPLEEREQMARGLAEMLGIVDNLNSMPKEVSGGQAARACIARALLLRPRIILADEPTSNLDENNARNVLEILEMIRQKLGVTIIVASHNREVRSFATQVVTLANGDVISELIERDDVERSL